MNEIDKYSDYFRRITPLIINKISWDDPILHISGEYWRFNARTEWRIVKDEKRVIGCYDNNSKVVLKSLIGLKIFNIKQQSRYCFDPIFFIEKKNIIEIFSSNTSEEVWSFHFTKDNIFIESNFQ